MVLIFNFLRQIYGRKKLLVVLIFFLSLFFFLFFLFFLKNIGPQEHRVPGTDYFTYYEPIANNILQGKGFVLEDKSLSGIGFVFPYFLAGVLFLSNVSGIDKFFLIMFFNVLITAFSVCFLFLSVEKIFNKKIALLSSFLWMSYPFNLWFLKNPNTEPLFILFFFLSILFFVFALKKKKMVLFFFSGLFSALSLATRLISLFLPIIFIFFIFLFLKPVNIKTKFLFCLVFAAGFFVIILPWIFYISPGDTAFVTLSERGPNIIVSGISWLAEPGKREILSEDVKIFIDRMNSQNLDTLAKTAKFFIRETLQRPIPVIKIIWLKLSRSWYGTSSRWKEEPLVLAIQLFYIISAIFGFKIIFKEKKEKIFWAIFLLTIIFYFWLMTFLVVSIMRYMVPIMGLVMIFSAIAFNKLFKKYGLFSISNNSLPE